ncbi:MAG: hypothetical protein ACI4KF_00540 [Huintestinicola sp.]
MVPVSEQLSVKSVQALYSASEMACAVTDSLGRRLYSNAAFDKLFCDDIPSLEGFHTGSSGARNIFSGGRLIKVHITLLNDRESMLNFSVFDTAEGMLSLSLVRDYITGISAAVRHAASEIGMAADAIYEGRHEDNEASLCSQLNTIDGAMLTLLSEFIVPEELAVKFGDDVPVPPRDISGELEDYAEAVSALLARHPVEFSAESIDRGIFAGVDTHMLRLILTDFIVKVLDGEVISETIRLSLSRLGDTAVLMIASGSANMIPQSPHMLFSSRAVKGGVLPSDTSGYLVKLFCDRYGCTFHTANGGGFRALGIKMPCSSSGSTLHSSVRFRSAPVRYSDENVMLSRFRLAPTYKTKGENQND